VPRWFRFLFFARILLCRTSRRTSHLSPLTSHLSPLTSHLSPLTSHLSPLTSHLSPLTSHLSPITLAAACRAAMSCSKICLGTLLWRLVPPRYDLKKANSGSQPQNPSRKRTNFERPASPPCLRIWLRRFGFAHDFSRLLLLGVRNPDHFFAVT
jgi:hypothetical protein